MNSSKNVVVLTNGLTGSSVLTGLLAQAGYWIGDEVFSKKDYNTYENVELVRLNQQLFAAANYTGDYGMVYDPADVQLFERARDTIDPAPYQDFLAVCAKNSPWLWKDPRLWLTIHYWYPLLDLDNIRFIVLTRDPLQTWISTTIRRQVHSPRFCRETMYNIRDSLTSLLRNSGQPYLELVYEDLVISPDATIARINDYLETGLTTGNLQKVFKGKLGRKQLGLPEFIKASLIYLKNYSQRYK